MKAFRVRKKEVVSNVNPIDEIEVFEIHKGSYYNKIGEFSRFSECAAVYPTYREAVECVKELLSKEIAKAQKQLAKLEERQKFFDLIEVKE